MDFVFDYDLYTETHMKRKLIIIKTTLNYMYSKLEGIKCSTQVYHTKECF